MSVRHCTATTAPCNCCPNCYAEQSHKDNVRSSAVGKQLKQNKSNSLSLAQHHLPALNLFWASFFVRVRLTSPLLISPGLDENKADGTGTANTVHGALHQLGLLVLQRGLGQALTLSPTSHHILFRFQPGCHVVVC